jgi:hypothetical protein
LEVSHHIRAISSGIHGPIDKIVGIFDRRMTVPSWQRHATIADQWLAATPDHPSCWLPFR